MRRTAIAKFFPALAFASAAMFAPGWAALRAEEPQPHLWQDFAPGENGEADSDPRNLVLLPEGTWFSARNREVGREAWVISRGSEEPELLADLCPGTCDSDPYGFAFSEAFLLFATGEQFAPPGTSDAPSAVWVTAGSSASTKRLFDLPAGSQPFEFWRNSGEPPARALDSGVVLFLMDRSSGDTEVWRSDGTAAGTYSLTSLAIGSFAGVSLRGTGPDRLLIASGFAGGQTEVWRTDG
ncbi:MAG: hypothetical protein ABIV06_06330, partial [Thermoanaerobaculia bacterium]